MTCSRRAFARRSLEALAATVAAGRVLGESRAFGAPAGGPPFLLHVHVRGALDPSYLFDARDPSVRRAGLKSCYLPESEARVPLACDATRQTTLLGPGVAPLAALFKDRRFSIVNGVHMAFPNDSHEQNTRYLFTGSATGALSYLNRIARAPATPKDRVFELLHIGADGFAYPASDFDRRIMLTPADAVKLASSLVHAEAALKSRGLRVARERATAIAAAAAGLGDVPAAGNYASGAAGLATGLRDLDAMQARLRRAGTFVRGIADAPWKVQAAFTPQDPNQPAPPPPPYQQAIPPERVLDAMRVAHGFFAVGLTQCALVDVSLDPDIDAHSPFTAKREPEIAAQIGGTLKGLFDYLREPWDGTSGVTVGDRVTLVISSEFGRTLFQLVNGQRPPVDDSGTDHNKLASTALLAGAGIAGGMLVGATDLTKVNAAGNGFADAMAHHLEYETKRANAPYDFLNCTMGRVYDFRAQRVVTDLGVAPDPGRSLGHIAYPSVNNTLLTMYGYDLRDATHRQEVFFRPDGAAQAPADPLTVLLARR
jgi:uncharacterized protein (DUF1501 family)